VDDSRINIWKMDQNKDSESSFGTLTFVYFALIHMLLLLFAYISYQFGKSKYFGKAEQEAVLTKDKSDAKSTGINTVNKQLDVLNHAVCWLYLQKESTVKLLSDCWKANVEKEIARQDKNLYIGIKFKDGKEFPFKLIDIEYCSETSTELVVKFVLSSSILHLTSNVNNKEILLQIPNLILEGGGCLRTVGEQVSIILKLKGGNECNNIKLVDVSKTSEKIDLESLEDVLIKSLLKTTTLTVTEQKTEVLQIIHTPTVLTPKKYSESPTKETSSNQHVKSASSIQPADEFIISLLESKPIFDFEEQSEEAAKQILVVSSSEVNAQPFDNIYEDSILSKTVDKTANEKDVSYNVNAIPSINIILDEETGSNANICTTKPNKELTRLVDTTSEQDINMNTSEITSESSGEVISETASESNSETTSETTSEISIVNTGKIADISEICESIEVVVIDEAKEIDQAKDNISTSSISSTDLSFVDSETDNPRESPYSTDDAREPLALTDDTRGSLYSTDDARESTALTDDTRESPALTDDTRESPALIDDTRESPALTDDTRESPALTPDVTEEREFDNPKELENDCNINETTKEVDTIEVVETPNNIEQEAVISISVIDADSLENISNHTTTSNSTVHQTSTEDDDGGSIERSKDKESNPLLAKIYNNNNSNLKLVKHLDLCLQEEPPQKPPLSKGGWFRHSFHHLPKDSAKGSSSPEKLRNHSLRQTVSNVSLSAPLVYIPNKNSALIIESEDEDGKLKYHHIPPLQASKGTFKQKGQKIHVYNDHLFTAVHFVNNLPKCGVCSHSLKGIGKQGYVCRDCGLITHKNCHYNVDHMCAKSSLPSLDIEYIGATDV